MPIHSNAGSVNSARPYGLFRLALKYASYFVSAKNGRGHGVHSPFVFDFIENILTRWPEDPLIEKIEDLRTRLLEDLHSVQIDDYGAGSSAVNGPVRTVSSIAGSSLKPPKYARLFHRMARHYRPAVMLELGTSLGLTTAYMASGNRNGKVLTLEGAPEISAMASRNFAELGLDNIRVVTGRFEETLDNVLREAGRIDLAFIDGNHRYAPTMEYFRKVRPFMAESSLIIFDDIHWSPEMEQSWNEISNDSSVSLALDIFFLGIAVINPHIKAKRQLRIRY